MASTRRSETKLGTKYSYDIERCFERLWLESKGTYCWLFSNQNTGTVNKGHEDYAVLPQVGTPQNSWWGCPRPKWHKNHTSRFGVAHTYMTYIREYPPPPPPSRGLFPPWHFLCMYFYSCEIVELTVKFNRSIFHRFNFLVKYSLLLIFNS